MSQAGLGKAAGSIFDITKIMNGKKRLSCARDERTCVCDGNKYPLGNLEKINPKNNSPPETVTLTPNPNPNPRNPNPNPDVVSVFPLGFPLPAPPNNQHRRGPNKYQYQYHATWTWLVRHGAHIHIHITPSRWSSCVRDTPDLFVLRPWRNRTRTISQCSCAFLHTICARSCCGFFLPTLLNTLLLTKRLNTTHLTCSQPVP